jgi:hypothetical protein
VRVKAEPALREESKTGVVVNGVLQSGHKGPGVEVPFDPGQKWGARPVTLSPGRRGYAVVVLVNRREVASAIVSRMRRFFVLIPESLARQAGVGVGDHIRFVVRPAAPPIPSVESESGASKSAPKKRSHKGSRGKR